MEPTNVHGADVAQNFLTPSEIAVFNEFMWPPLESRVTTDAQPKKDHTKCAPSTSEPQFLKRKLDSPPDTSVIPENIYKQMGSIVVFKKTLGKGGFGIVHEGHIMKDDTVIPVAVKLQKVTDDRKTYDNELNFYTVSRAWNDMVMPRLYHFSEDSEHRALAIDLLGSSLKDLFIDCKRKFSLKTILLLFDQMISRLEELHEKGYIHKDIKPENFVIGRNESKNVVYIIDYGQVEQIIDGNGKHKKKEFKKNVSGTLRFMSIHAHLGKQQSRRDDLYSLYYCLMYFLNGSLPWQNEDYSTFEDKLINIFYQKNELSKNLTKDAPAEFRVFYDLVARLKFLEKPDYSRYKNLFRSLAIRNGIEYDNQFNWSDMGNSSHDNTKDSSNVHHH